ncbi:hypothetical protein TSL6_04470 [Sulfurovum sp. TSL6]|uniref:nuclear transport factor 2 family protein n=1 Tax=Sulfurovum sp. TSL6 TaxID=2826995 RepID=UPI001CC52E07|nr:nuclear transport factor 2 family protein [Sulfurovum sp. TSL6]GIT99940.1 hypothetical protein TSL6_04470 [Sulfurovum sp. TSL6]
MNQEKLSHFFETLNEGVDIESFGIIYDVDVVFKDPFNKVKGIRAVYEIFEHMYQALDKPRFIIKEYIDRGNVVYVKWDFIFTFKGEKNENRFEGVSRLQINNQGKVISHVDFWDAAEHMYEKMPVIGTILRLIKRKISRS